MLGVLALVAVVALTFPAPGPTLDVRFFGRNGIEASDPSEPGGHALLLLAAALVVLGLVVTLAVPRYRRAVRQAVPRARELPPTPPGWSPWAYPAPPPCRPRSPSGWSPTSSPRSGARGAAAMRWLRQHAYL